MLEANVLGQLLVMQSILINLPDKKSIFNFVCQGLLDIPGIANVDFYEANSIRPEKASSQVSYPIVAGNSMYGELVLELSKIDLFKPYEEYLKNFIFMTGIILEERNQRQIIKQHQELLEKRILARTQELSHEKENLIESQRRFTDMMKSVNLLSVMLDANRNIIFCNNYLLQLSGYTTDEVMGKNWVELFLPKELKEPVNKVFQEIMDGEELWANHENEIITKHGHKLLISWNNTILRDDQKQIIGTASIGENITERKKAEAALKNSEEHLRLITDNIPVFISHFNREFEFLFVNKPYSNLYSASPGTLIGKKAMDVVGTDLFEAAFPYMKQALDGKIVHHEHKFTGKDGQTNYLYSTYVPHFENDVVSGFFVLAWDITELKQNELNLKLQNEEYQSLNEEYAALNEELSISYEHMVKTNSELEIAKHKAEESDRLKTAFLQNMSHEIRTPLNAIMGFADIMVNYFDDKDKLEKFATIIKQRGEDLLSIINDILDIARLESGQLQLHLEKFKIPAFFEELEVYFTEYRTKINKQDIRFITNTCCGNNDVIFMTDQAKLRQIFVNLLSNAFKFTESGTIEAGCFRNEEGQLVFYVSDTGIGIPAEKHTAIFERFVQIEDDASRLYGGAGLGLSIVKGLLSLLGGDIWLTSEPGKGSTFNFILPFKTSNSMPNTPKKISTKMNAVNTQTTILIVEDDCFNAEFLKEVLKKESFILLYAKNGQESVDIATSQHVDIILMDIRLPDIDGYEAARLIREQKPNVKIIAQTAYASIAEEQKAKNAGCNDYISKPINRILLLSKIKGLITPV